jgi:hypothetical protein
MSFPATVLQGNFPYFSPIGPFEYQRTGGATDRYGVAFEYAPGPTYGLAVVKSTDGGNTWAVMDAADAPAATDGNAGAGPIFPLSVAQSTVDGALWITYATTGNVPAMVRYDPDADEWGTPVIGTAPDNWAAEAAALSLFSCYNPASNFIVVVTQAILTGDGYPQWGVAIFDISGNNWGAWTAMGAPSSDNTITPSAIALGLNGLVHALASVQNNDVDGSVDVYQQAIKQDGTLGTFAIVPSTHFSGDGYVQNTIDVYAASGAGHVWIAATANDATNDGMSVQAGSGISADPIDFSLDLYEMGGAIDGHGQVALCAANAATIWAAFFGTSDDYIAYWEQAFAGGAVLMVVIGDTTTVYLYDQNGTGFGSINTLSDAVSGPPIALNAFYVPYVAKSRQIFPQYMKRFTQVGN